VKPDEIRPSIRAVRALAEYFSSQRSERPVVADTVNGWREPGSGMDSDAIASVVAATILATEGRTADAFKSIAKEETIEQ